MDGPTACKRIRELGSDVFIVGITGNVLPEDVAYFKSCGANDVLSKPVRLSDIDCVWMEFGVYDRDPSVPR
jgi:CheY-like chemotaxis protein